MTSEQYLNDTHHTRYSGATSDYLHFGCKACGGWLGKSGVLSLEYDLTMCYRPSCPLNGSWMIPQRYVAHIEGITIAEAWDIVQSDRRKETLLERASRVQRVEVRKKGERLELPEGYTPMIFSDGESYYLAKSYIEKRGLDCETAFLKYGMGYVGNNGGDYANRIIVPIYNEKLGLVYYQGRDFTGFSKERWTAPSISKSFLFNQNRLLTPGTVYITEGAFDATEVDKRVIGVAILGTKMTDLQLMCLASGMATEVVVVLDEGAELEANKRAARIVGWLPNTPVYWCCTKGGDCSSLGVEETVRQVDLYKKPISKNSIRRRRKKSIL